MWLYNYIYFLILFIGDVTNAALKILVTLFKPINVSKRMTNGNSKTYFRPSKLEIQQSFIYYINVRHTYIFIIEYQIINEFVLYRIYLT